MTSPERNNVAVAGQHGLSDFLNALFELLEREQIRYCVLHSWEDLPDLLETGRDLKLDLKLDLNLGVDPRQAAKLDGVVRALSHAGYAPIQAMNYQVNACAHVFAWFEGASVTTVVVDFAFDHRERSFQWKSGRDLVWGRQRWGNLWTASAATEFRHLLLKTAGKGWVPEAHFRRLCLLIGDLGRRRAEEIACEVFGPQKSCDIVEACLEGRLEEIVPGLWSVLQRRRLMLRPWSALRCTAQDWLRRARLWLKPAGLSIVLLGPDGVGKALALSGDEQAILAGIQPLPPRDLRRQRVPYRKLGAAMPEAYVVETDSRIESTLAAVSIARHAAPGAQLERMTPS